MKDKFNLFIQTIDDEAKELVEAIHNSLIDENCICDIKEAKSGYVVSYLIPKTKRIVANFITRKSGVKIRIYPDHIANYDSMLDSFPDKAKKDIKKASVCKRLINPDDCNPKCKMGFTFKIDNETFQKCRYMAFQITINKENQSHVLQLLNKEITTLGENI